jgi:parallel beta-helix repeat protein
VNRLLTTAVLSTLAISTVLALGPARAHAQPGSITCGTTLTTDTKLTSDLLNCPNNGLVIGADDITLDLNGHTIGGDGTPVASCPDAVCDVGIDNSAGHTAVTIKGGRVRSFNVAVLVLGASADHLKRIRSANNSSIGMLVGRSSASRLDHNTSVHDGISGIVVFDSNNLRLDHNSVTGAHGYGIPVFDSRRSQIEQNMLDGNDHGILLDGSHDNTVHGNRVSHSGGSSIDLGNANNNHVSENVLTDNGDGVILYQSDGNNVADNSVTGTGFFGFPYTGGFGVIFDGADNNLVQRNTVTGGRGPAILVTSLDSPEKSDHNTIAYNVVNSKLYTGIAVAGDATATLLKHNTANGNGDDGIYVDAAGTTVTANTANDNFDLGIEAASGVIDGGGNKATGNGNPAQCLNVACR